MLHSSYPPEGGRRFEPSLRNLTHRNVGFLFYYMGLSPQTKVYKPIFKVYALHSERVNNICIERHPTWTIQIS